MIRVAAEDREAVLHATRLRVEPLDTCAGVVPAVPDPDRIRTDGDLSGPVRDDSLHREREAVDDRR